MSHRAKPPLADLEAALGHTFADRTLMERALTHISAVAGSSRIASYQRLEFLGDRVLGLCIADMLFRAYPQDEEGAMSRRLADLVRKEACAEVALAWGANAHLRLGSGENQSGVRKRITVLGDICEALIGAVFLDAGYAAALAVVERAWGKRLRAPLAPPTDAKTVLQEWAQARSLKAPTYRMVSRTGPDHNPRFVVAVDIETQHSAEGEGRSKRLAEQAAAAAFMAREGVGFAAGVEKERGDG